MSDSVNSRPVPKWFLENYSDEGLLQFSDGKVSLPGEHLDTQLITDVPVGDQRSNS